MSDIQAVIQKVHAAFDLMTFPGEAFLQGSFLGDEPYDEVGAFRNQTDWRSLRADFLDAHYAAPSFFSPAGFRFFMPAYLIADLNGQLQTADPIFHLTHGFSDISVNVPAGGRIFVIRSGRSTLINPRLYGAMTFGDYARYRLSIFTREEASAIVTYLEWVRDQTPDRPDQPAIEAALQSFWLERSRTAPTAENLQQHNAEQEEYVAALRSVPPTR